MVVCWIWTLGLSMSFLSVLPAADEWPQFRGAGGAGLASGPSLPTEWSASKNVLWKATIPGYGWSCPILWGERVFVTTAVSEKQKKPGGGGGGGEPPPDAVFRWEVHCLDATTGKTLWQQVAAERKPTVG